MNASAFDKPQFSRSVKLLAILRKRLNPESRLAPNLTAWRDYVSSDFNHSVRPFHGEDHVANASGRIFRAHSLRVIVNAAKDLELVVCFHRAVVFLASFVLAMGIAKPTARLPSIAFLKNLFGDFPAFAVLVASPS